MPPLRRRSRGARQRFLHLLIAVLAAGPLLIVWPVPASAHPLDVYLQASYLTLSSSSITVELDLSPGVLVVAPVLEQLDADGDRTINDREARAYAETLMRQVNLTVDGRAAPLTLTGVEAPSYLTVKAGYGVLRIFSQAAAPTGRAGTHALTFRNGCTAPGIAFQVNAFPADREAVTVVAQERDAAQQQSTITYRIGPGPTFASSPDVPARVPPRAGRLLTYLQQPSLPLGALLLATALAATLGALHALTPGHAKTLMAAYLVGSGGTARDAATLGAVITVTHTASVVVIGLIALLASRFLVPGILVPGLEVLAGVLVVGLGIRLLRERWPGRVTDHVHDDAHGQITHAHGGTTHTHGIPAGGVSTRNLVALGVSGGLVPCPEALGVMILAVGVHRTLLGLGLIVSFSLGLAAVLIGLGLVLVRSRSLAARLSGPRMAGGLTGRLVTALPLISAVIVTGLGAGLLVRGAAAIT